LLLVLLSWFHDVFSFPKEPLMSAADCFNGEWPLPEANGG
jgi:hypothetical protein